MDILKNLQRKVNTYKEVLSNTVRYREIWKTSLKEEIKKNLTEYCQSVGLEADIEIKSQIDNLEAIVLSLGDDNSGLSESITDEIKRPLIKHNGSLVYQQLFNGKIMAVINYPFIEKYGQQQPPKMIAIYRPEELIGPFCERHLEQFMDEINRWEDYDDDKPEANHSIGFKMNFDQTQTT